MSDTDNTEGKNLSPEEAYNKRLGEELAVYHKAIEEEFKGVDSTNPEVARKAKDKVIELVPHAGTTVHWLIQHAESESVRATLSKWVLQVAMADAAVTGKDDELTKFIESLRVKAAVGSDD